MERQDYLDANARSGFDVPMPELIEDADGAPLGVIPSDAEWAYNTTAVTVAELERVGLTAADVPNLTILEIPKGPAHD